MVAQVLLQMTYTYRARKPTSQPRTDGEGVIYVNPPTDDVGYDDAYKEARTLFEIIFGHDEEFLVREERNDDIDED
jgi:hypothetical protein